MIEVPAHPYAVGYRLLLSARQEGHSQVVDRASQVLLDWLAAKKYVVTAIRENAQADIGKGATVSVRRIRHGDADTTFQATVVESNATGIWTSQLTVFAPGDARRDADVSLEIAGPIRPVRPRLPRMLVEALPLHDSLSELRTAPTVVSPEQVEMLVDVICDPDRRGVVYVAGMSEALPFDPWYDHVTQICAPSIGLAGSYFLSAAATRQFRRAVGEQHAVPVGAIRTYLPGADPASDLDALRHRFLSTARIARDSSPRLGALLHERARGVVLRAILPAGIRQAAGVITAEEERPGTVIEMPDLVLARDADENERREQAARQGLSLAFRVLRVAEPGDADWERITDLALAGRRAEDSEARALAQVSQLREALVASELERLELQVRLDDERLEHSQSLRNVSEKERRNAYLERLLKGSNRAADLFADAGALEPEEVDDFEDLLTLAGDLQHVVLTGEKSITRALMEHDPLGDWARKTWLILGALEDYAQASLDGRCSSGVDIYLKRTPDGYRTLSANRHALTESEAVRSNAKHRAARVFPVPTSVSPEGCVEMMAHFRISQFGTVSPRLHYYDDTARSGKVYVGYIGPHLPTKRTN